MFWLVWGCARDWFLSCLTWSIDGSNDIDWLSGWSLLKSLAGMLMQKSVREIVKLWLPWGRKLEAGEYNKTPKALRKKWGETLRGIRAFKSSHEYRRIG